MDENQAREAARDRYLLVLKRLREKPLSCPYCETEEWGIADLVEVPIRIQEPSIATGIMPRQSFVYVPLGCLNCGYTMYFHSGILDGQARNRGIL